MSALSHLHSLSAPGGSTPNDDRAGGVTGSNRGHAWVIDGATGLSALTKQEADVLKSGFPDTPLRGYTGMTGHAMEASFPLGIALAALSLDAKAPVPIFNDGEASMSAPAEKIAVTTVGLQRGEGVAVLVGEK